MLTGCRKSEIAALGWCEVKADKIELPAARTKTAHVVHITPAMRRIIEAQRRETPDGRHVFGMAGGSHLKDAIVDRLAPGVVEGWTVHDLRRSFVSGCARIGIAPHTIERCVNHALGRTLGATAKIYQRYGFETEMADAWSRWSDHVEKIAAK
jgi:integrase